jgi:hypothetical protein
MSDASPSIEVLPRPAPPRRGLRALLGALAAVVLVGGTVVAVGALGADGTASSPEAPVRALFDHAASGDVEGMLDQLLPGEREALARPLTDLVAQLERLGVLGDVDLDNLKGYSLQVSGLDLDAQTRRDDLAFVRVTGGTATWSFAPSDLPLGSLLPSVLGAQPSASSPSRGSTDLGGGGPDAGLVTVKRDGRWYVSIGYTIAEQARASSGRSIDDLGQRVTATGADSPEDAVRQLLEHGAELDLRGVLGLLPPGEMGALQEYAGLFLPEVEQAIAAEPDRPTITIDSLELASDVDGDVATVTVEKLTGTATVPGGGSYALDADGCVTIREPGAAPQRTCVDDLPMQELGPSLGGLELAGGTDTAVRTVKVDGRWYVSPVRTMLDGLVASLRSVQPGDLSSLVQTLQGLAGGLGSAGSGSGSGSPAPATTATTTVTG